MAVGLKEYIKNNLEKLLNDKLREIKTMPKNIEEEGEEEHIKITEIKIADIVFAFNNDKIIKLLKERGQHLMYQRYEKSSETEKKLWSIGLPTLMILFAQLMLSSLLKMWMVRTLLKTLSQSLTSGVPS